MPKSETSEDVHMDEATNKKRVDQLERKFGGYRMQSRLFSYDELKLKPNFQIIKFKDAVYRGLILNADKREGLGVM